MLSVEKEVFNGGEEVEIAAFVDMVFDFYGKRIAMLTAENTIQIWDSCLNTDEENDSPKMEWKPTSYLEYTYGTVNQVVWAHPKVGQVIAVSSTDKNQIAIYKEKSEIINEDAEITDYLNDNPLKKWIIMSVINLPFMPSLHMNFAPIEMGLTLSVVTGDQKVFFYSPTDSEYENWELIDSIECSFACSKIVWNPSFKEKIPKHRLYTSLHRTAPVAQRASNKARLTILDIELSKLPFVPTQSDLYIIMPHERMFAIVSKEEEESANNKMSLCKYSKISKYWHELTLDIDINGAIHDLSFAPRLSRPYDIIAMAIDSKVFIYSLFHIMDNTRNIYPKICLTHTFGDKDGKVMKVGWDHFASTIYAAKKDGTVNLWRRNIKGNFLKTASVLTIS